MSPKAILPRRGRNGEPCANVLAAVLAIDACEFQPRGTKAVYVSGMSPTQTDFISPS
jgi:hypothetical protein